MTTEPSRQERLIQYQSVYEWALNVLAEQSIGSHNLSASARRIGIEPVLQRLTDTKVALLSLLEEQADDVTEFVERTDRLLTDIKQLEIKAQRLWDYFSDDDGAI